MPALPIITRAQWGARKFARPRTTVSISSRKWFVVHYPGAGTPPKDVKAYAKWIERIHMDQNGWAGVGYNYFIGADGQIAEGCGRDIVGAHSPNHNVDGIGVNLWTSNGQPTDAALRSCIALYQLLSKQAGHALRKGYHGMDYATECPGPVLRAWVKAGMPSPGGVSGSIEPTNPSKPNKPAEPEKEWWEMPIPQKDLEAIADAVLTRDNVIPAPRDITGAARKKNPYWTLAAMVESTQAYAVIGAKQARVNGKLLELLAKNPGGLTADQVQKALADALSEIATVEPAEVTIQAGQ